MNDNTTDLMRRSAAPIVSYRWRDLSLSSLAWFYAQAIRELGTPVAFTLHLTKNVKERMPQVPALKRDYIALRMRKWLPQIPFFFVIEKSREKTLHIHGLIATANQSHDELRRALQKVAGDRRKLDSEQLWFLNNRAVDVRSVSWVLARNHQREAFGWAQYTIKSHMKACHGASSAKRFIHASASVNRQARAIHRECRFFPIAKAA